MHILILDAAGGVEIGIVVLEEKLVMITQSIKRVPLLKPSSSLLRIHLQEYYLPVYFGVINNRQN